jgi:hypothetical protein
VIVLTIPSNDPRQSAGSLDVAGILDVRMK